jgi:superfamily I DNA/RNA helicase
LRAGLQAIGDLDLDLVPLIKRVLDEVTYRAEVQRLYPDPKEAERRWQAVGEILNFAENYSRKKRPGPASLAGFLNELSLNANDSPEAEDANKRGAVTLMTMHASKGLEYPRVYIVGLEEGLLPHTRSIEEDTIEEERRLTYVGITRAQQSLTLTYCLERARYGQRVVAHPSRFLFEIKGSPPPANWEAAGARVQRRGKKKKPKTRRRRRTAP